MPSWKYRRLFSFRPRVLRSKGRQATSKSAPVDAYRISVLRCGGPLDVEFLSLVSLHFTSTGNLGPFWRMRPTASSTRCLFLSSFFLAFMTSLIVLWIVSHLSLQSLIYFVMFSRVNMSQRNISAFAFQATHLGKLVCPAVSIFSQ